MTTLEEFPSSSTTTTPNRTRPSSRRSISYNGAFTGLRQPSQFYSPPPNNPRFSRLLNTVLGSPFITTSDPDQLAPELDLVDGAPNVVHRAYTVTRPSSPAPTADFSIIGQDELDDVSSPYTTAGGSPFRSLLPRLWDVLSSPGRSPSPRPSLSSSRKGKVKIIDRDTNSYINYCDLPPLDGEEGELIDDEACFIDARAVTGIDIITLLPPEIALTIFSKLPPATILACLCVCKSWHVLAADNAIWRVMFINKWGALRNDQILAYNWRHLYKQRVELDHRWEGISPAPSSTGGRYLRGTAPSLPVISNVPFAPWEPKVTRIVGHTDSVYCLEFDSSRIITGSRDRTIKVWSLKTGKLLGTLRGAHRGSVLCLKFEGDWNQGETGFMVSGSSDCSVCVWDLWTAEEEGTAGESEVKAAVKAVLKGHVGGVLDLRISKAWVVSCSKDAVIRVWDRKRLELYRTLRGHEGPVNAVGLRGGKVVSASGDGKMILWDIESGERLRTFEGHDRGLACIEFKDDMIVSGSNDCKIKLWSASTGECLRTLVGHEALVRALAFDPRTGRLVSASYDKTVKVWDLGSGKMVREFKNTHTSHIFDVKFDAARIHVPRSKIVVLDFSAGLDPVIFF
ncbi:WD40-repeat-containing domain protein [Infundibulicybe gibba]|nr:WD40-repeat-containing domain protein [Infundibulicybe gibba]